MENVMLDHIPGSRLTRAIAQDCGYSKDEAELVAARNIIEALANAYGMSVQLNPRKSLTQEKDSSHGP
jgi:hypothetical protein